VRVPVGVSSQVADVANLTTGIRKPLGTGGTIVASTGFEYSNNKTPDIILSPDPSWATNVTLGIEQPLLRNFSTDIARTEIALSRNAHRRELLNLHAQLLRTVSEVEAAYWQLAFARRILAVRHGLLAMTRETRDIVMDRGAIDALAPQQAESQSFVEAARAEVVRASINIRVASDRLKQLINDPGLPISGETLIIPIDEPVEVPVEYSLLDAVMAGMRNRPESRQALLNIDDASLRLKFFDNQRLPNLVVNAQLQYHGLNDDDRRVYNSYGNLTDGDFIEYLIGAQFEAPIGNRRARAVYQRSRLERQARIVELERTMQAILLDVKEWLREQQSAYQRIHVERDARRAAAEYLRTLTLRVQQIEGLTPGHVDQRLRAQQQLANAQLRELEAIVQYNVAIMQVRRAQGTLLEHNNIEMQWPDDMFADR
jgi:outer membrane protein